MSWALVFTPRAQDDARRLAEHPLRQRIEQLLALIAEDPFASTPPFETLCGDLHGLIARRINFQHRLLYQPLPRRHVVKVCRLWTPTVGEGRQSVYAPIHATVNIMQFFKPGFADHPRFPSINAWYLGDETEVVSALLKEATLPAATRDRVAERARALVAEVRRQRVKGSGIDAFMHEYELSSQEGVVLMCLAEALLRIPDDETRDALIEDKIGSGDWEKHLGRSESLFVNASTWGLMLTGRMLKLRDSKHVLSRLVQRSGEPVVRQAVAQAMRIMGRQFVMGRTIREATDRAKTLEKQGYRYSYDMLGEAARTAEDAERYFKAYLEAIEAIGKVAKGRGPLDSPGISVKLSALHPRYELLQGDRVLSELVPRLKALALKAKTYDIGMTVDAEEADRLDISMEAIDRVFSDPELDGWNGFGLALQAYQKRAFPMLDWMADRAQAVGRKMMVRLVKGAYWDTEIKRAQERGLPGYPVFTRKASTDVSYLACARKLLARRDVFYPQFATHNAHSLAAVVEMAGEQRGGFEFQRLHGMGEALYTEVVGKNKLDIPCRIYAPVGSHEDLLAYLVRRLLENGANTSFVNRIVDEKAPIDEIIADPVTRVAALTKVPHPNIPLPRDLYGQARRNSLGVDLSDIDALTRVQAGMNAAAAGTWRAGPIIGGVMREDDARPVYSPIDRGLQIGMVSDGTAEDVKDAIGRAARAYLPWDRQPAGERAAILDRCADLLEADMHVFLALCTREAGKTLMDGVAEVREAADFCRYYAMLARTHFANPQTLNGPTGELDQYQLHGRGVFACISPWNFPLAIFAGQISAALAAGNAVVAKPAEQTALIAAHAVRLMHKAGVPDDVLQLIPGDGPTVGAALVGDVRIAGVAFTGSTETARLINRTLAERNGPIVPFIAETGGMNAMIVDSSALPEQVVADVLASSFQSAGQRCSALRILCVQEDIADRLITMLKGAMAELRIGDPSLMATDVGPVIDTDAQIMLQRHIDRMDREAKCLHKVTLPEATRRGTFVPPAAYEIKGIDVLEREIFGPILHVVRYKASQLDQLIDAINATGYGLTFGIHSRIDTTVRHIIERVHVGNVYVNRNIIGAVVGVQPFGGEGLSGTGPKAGGPNYLFRFAAERSVSINTTAAGGNASLMSLEETEL